MKPNNDALYAIFGCGGFGRQVAMLLRSIDAKWPLVFVSERIEPNTVLGIKVLSATDFFANFDRIGIRNFNVAIQNSSARSRIAAKCLKQGLIPFTIEHPTAVRYGHDSMGAGAILCDFVSIHPDTKIGRFVHCNSFTYIGHDCVIGDFATLTHHIGLNGHVSIGEHAFIGTAAQIRPGVNIGAHTVIGMGSIVLNDVPPYATVAGNPARIIKQSSVVAI